MPESADGLGLSDVDLVGVLEEAGWAALPEPLLETAALAAPMLAALLPAPSAAAALATLLTAATTSNAPGSGGSPGARRASASSGSILICLLPSVIARVSLRCRNASLAVHDRCRSGGRPSGSPASSGPPSAPAWPDGRNPIPVSSSSTCASGISLVSYLRANRSRKLASALSSRCGASACSVRAPRRISATTTAPNVASAPGLTRSTCTNRDRSGFTGMSCRRAATSRYCSGGAPTPRASMAAKPATARLSFSPIQAVAGRDASVAAIVAAGGGPVSCGWLSASSNWLSTRSPRYSAASVSLMSAQVSAPASTSRRSPSRARARVWVRYDVLPAATR